MKQQVLLDWYDENKRDLPWRKTTPWGVMVSEFMLQQTPVNRVLPVWNQWLKVWPTPAKLADAKKSEVITAWGRLGYPRRAIRLHESAQIITRDFNNSVPKSVEDLRSLPGVGEYTAAAIAAFAYGQSTLVLDVNIRRFFARLFDGVEHPINSISTIERELRQKLIPQDGATWAAATMEFGALICTSKNPACELCPLKRQCAWRKAGYPKSELIRKAQAWSGTDRQCRGTIIQALREKTEVSEDELGKLWSNPQQLINSINSLVKEGFITQFGKVYRLAN